MKKVIFVLFIIFGQASLAQKFNGFYIEPLINVKTTVFTKKELPATLITPYFEIKPQNLITPIGLNVGLNIGYKFKNNDIVQLGIFQDESLSGIIFTGNSYTSFGSNASYSQIRYTHFGGVTVKNINLLYKRNLLTYTFKKSRKENYFDLHFNIGLTYFYKPNNGLENLTGIDGVSYYSSDSSLVTLQEGQWVFPLPFKYSFKFNTGLEFTFGNKKSEWFTIGISYISNLSKSNYYNFSSSSIVVKSNSDTFTYNYYVVSRGNGIYYQISKRIYPFKWGYSRQQRKLQEYNNKQ